MRARILGAVVLVVTSLAVFATRPDELRGAPLNVAAAGEDTLRPRIVRPRARRSASTESSSTSRAAAEVARPVASGPCVISGRVVDRDGAAVADAFVAMLGPFGTMATRRADDEGAFRFETTDAVAVRCAASATDRVPAVGPWAVAAPGGAIDVGSLTLVAGTPITGTVRDAQGRGVRGAQVRCTPADPAALERWESVVDRVARTVFECDDDGAFVAASLPSGRYRVEASPTGNCDWWGAAQTVRTGDPPVVLALPEEISPRAVSVSVRAQDESGEPLSVFRVFLSTQDRSEEQWADDGVVAASLRGVPPFRLRVSARSFADARIDSVEPTGGPIVVRLTRPAPIDDRYRIRGVVEFDGSPLRRRARVEVLACPSDDVRRSSDVVAWCRADAGGGFSLDTPPGVYRLVASGRVVVNDERIEVDGTATDVQAGDASVRLAVRPEANISARLSISDGTSPDEAWLSVTDERLLGSERTKSFQGASGVMEGLSADGVYDVAVSVRHGTEWMRGVVVRGVTANGVRLDMAFEPGLAIEGSVVRADGSPVVAAQVRTEAERPHRRVATTDLDGRFRLTGLREGWESLHASAPGLRAECDATTVQAGGVAVRLVMSPPR